ncbi:MAG: DUF3375 family protein [Desulfobacterales bacterium]|nr:DUF3375 family protein [Desulfobacterales bacterium]
MQQADPLHKYEEFKSIIDNSPSIKILRGNSPLVLSFLAMEFKDKGNITISNADLVQRLSAYLDMLDETSLTSPLDKQLLNVPNDQKAKELIELWCSEDKGFLRKYVNDSGEHMHELSSETEKTLLWLESLKKQEFIGAESRFQDIKHKLRELLDNSSSDPQKKIRELKEKRDQIDQEISMIELSGRVNPYNSTQIKERFFEINRMARTFTSDFNGIAQNFREIKQNISEQHYQNCDRGTILGYTLDAMNAMEQSDQGKTFASFMRFLLRDSETDELNLLTQEVFDIMEHRGIPISDPYLKNIKKIIFDASIKLEKYYDQLIDQLHRSMTDRSMSERKKTLSLINEIKHLALRRVNLPIEEKVFIEIEGNADLSMVMDRPLMEYPKEKIVLFNRPETMSKKTLEVHDLAVLYEQEELDAEKYRQQILELLKSVDHINLQELISYFPLEKGLGEILTYFSLTNELDSTIDKKNRICLELFNDESTRTVLDTPQIIYYQPHK